MGAHRQTFPELVIHTPHASVALRAAVDVLDVRLPRAVRAARRPERLRVRDRQGERPQRRRRPHRPRRPAAPLIVDALGWRRMLVGDDYQPPDAPLSRGLEVHPHGAGEDLEVWIDRKYVPAGYGWSFPAADEVRVGVGSFDPRFHVKEPDGAGWRRTSARTPSATRATGSRTRSATAAEDGVFFVGDSAGHCLPLTAEGIRTACYFGIACGRELQQRGRGARSTRERRSRATTTSATGTRGSSTGCCACRADLPRVPPAARCAASSRAMGRPPSRSGRSGTTCRSPRRRQMGAVRAPIQ